MASYNAMKIKGLKTFFSKKILIKKAAQQNKIEKLRDVVQTSEIYRQRVDFSAFC